MIKKQYYTFYDDSYLRPFLLSFSGNLSSYKILSVIYSCRQNIYKEK